MVGNAARARGGAIRARSRSAARCFDVHLRRASLARFVLNVLNVLKERPMTHDLQVSFRRLIPNESLVCLAATRYRRLGALVPGPSQCLVSLESFGRRARALTRAQVRLECD